MTDSIISLPIPAAQEIRTVSWQQGNLVPGDLVEHSPVTVVETREGRWIRSLHMRTWTVPMVEGATYVRRYWDDRDDYKSRWAVVRDGTLVELDRIQMEDLLCPEHAEARAAYRRQQEHERRYAVSRHRGTGMTVGVYESIPGVLRYCVRATARQYWSRDPSPEEIAAYEASLEAEAACGKSDGVRL
ncbi:hypothetical protein [Microvirga yunnanensis]|uniref:hypothetical protein n=1 Tax=Microvirga yunnanensis TaxID=2953740 RepID=UPI0021C91E6D|nr:hypothetical protein [Microvirga sp. HBU67655]